MSLGTRLARLEQQIGAVPIPVVLLFPGDTVEGVKARQGIAPEAEVSTLRIVFVDPNKRA